MGYLIHHRSVTLPECLFINKTSAMILLTQGTFCDGKLFRYELIKRDLREHYVYVDSL